jgi:hypothetical protein
VHNVNINVNLKSVVYACALKAGNACSPNPAGFSNRSTHQITTRYNKKIKKSEFSYDFQAVADKTIRCCNSSISHFEDSPEADLIQTKYTGNGVNPAVIRNEEWNDHGWYYDQ